MDEQKFFEKKKKNSTLLDAVLLEIPLMSLYWFCYDIDEEFFMSAICNSELTRLFRQVIGDKTKIWNMQLFPCTSKWFAQLGEC